MYGKIIFSQLSQYSVSGGGVEVISAFIPNGAELKIIVLRL